MELVKFKNNGGGVMVRIKVVGRIAWRYVYVSEDKKFIKTSQSPPPYDHLLGFPHELENDVHSWDVQIGNYSDENQNYEVEVIWLQDEDELFKWSKKNSLSPASAKVEKGDALLVGI